MSEARCVVGFQNSVLFIRREVPIGDITLLLVFRKRRLRPGQKGKEEDQGLIVLERRILR
jgi:hypothetical protein